MAATLNAMEFIFNAVTDLVKVFRLRHFRTTALHLGGSELALVRPSDEIIGSKPSERTTDQSKGKASATPLHQYAHNA